MDTVSESSTPVSSINGYNNKISQLLDERNSDSSVGDNSEVNSPAAILLKSYLRDAQRFTQNVSPAVSKLNESIKEVQDAEVNNELCGTPKSVNVIRKKRFDVSSPSAILRERNPFPKEVFDDIWAEEEELPPPLPFNELLKGLHMYAEVRDKEDNRSAGFKVLLRSMGAIVHDKLDSEVTHVIFREGQVGTYKKAKKQNCHLLSMLWLHAVRNTGRRVPEENYPALNLDIYESPLAVKKLRKIKSMQPDYEGVRQDYHRKRLEKVYKQKLAGISSTNGSDTDDKSSITSTPTAARKRKSDILPDKKINNSRRRRTTIMSTTTMESDMSDENKSRKPTKSNQRRKTEIFRSSPVSNKIGDSNILKERNVLTSNMSSVLENRNVVVNQTLRPSAVMDLVQGSQDLFGNIVELKHKKDNQKMIENDDNESELTRYSLKDRNVVVNCTLTPPRVQDVLDRSQEVIEKKIQEQNSLRSPSIASDAASQDNDFTDSPDLKRVLDAIQNDNSGSLRKKLLKGLGIQCPSDKKRDSIKKSPKKTEVFSFVTLRKTNNLITEKEDDNDNSKNKTASTIWGDSPLLNHKNNETEEEVACKHNDIKEMPSTRTRAVRTPIRYLDGIENNESSSIKSTGRRRTIAQKIKKIEEIKPTKRRTRLFQEFKDDSALEKSIKEKSFIVNDSEIDESELRMKQSTVTNLAKVTSEIPQKIKTFEENKSTRRQTRLFKEFKGDSALEKSKKEKNSIISDSEIDENDLRIKQSIVKKLDKVASEVPQKLKTVEENESTRRRTRLFQESKTDRFIEKNSLVNSESDLRTKKTVKNLIKETPAKRYEDVSSDEETLKNINKRISATEPRKMNTRRSIITKNSNDVLLRNSNKLPNIIEESTTTNPQTVLKSKALSKKPNKSIPASEPSRRNRDTSHLNSRMSKKIKLFDPTLDAIDSDLSLPEVTESVENPYELEDKTPKRRKIDLKEDKNRRSTFWFQTPEEKQKAGLKKSTQNCKTSQKKLPTIVCTRLHGDQIDVFNQIVKKLGGFEIENNVSSATTHLVVGEPSRTLNMLRAIIRGCWIVNYEWLLQSLEMGNWLQEELYEVTEFSPAVKKCRIERQTFGEPYAMNLFNECGKIYIGAQTSPKSSDLEQLIKLAGGTVVSSPRLARIVVGQTYSHADNSTVCVTEKWVLESIAHKSVKSLKKFLLSTNNVDSSICS